MKGNETMKTRRNIILALFAVAYFTISPTMQATCQEGCDLTYGNTLLGDNALISNTDGYDNIAIGQGALFSNTTGFYNTASGVFALYSNTTGASNTATGSFALNRNTTGQSNTAIGSEVLERNTTGTANTGIGGSALYSNTTGSNNTATGVGALVSNGTGNYNTASGNAALQSNTTGFDNTATGAFSLANNTTASNNTANGYYALVSNTTGSANAAIGAFALKTNKSGFNNTASGVFALQNNTTGSENTATGYGALAFNTTGNDNTAIGINALFNNTIGGSNVAVGNGAGSNLTTGGNNIDIGALGVAGESNKIRIGKQGTQNGTFIAGISGVAVTGTQVVVNANGRLGVAASSARFKDAIKPMDKASEAILALKPVTFRYKKEIDEAGIPQFGLVAEEVEKVDPALVSRDADGKAYTVRYDAVNAMLLNEFLKEHKKLEEQQRTIAELKSTVAEQRKDFEAISAQKHKEIQAFTASLKEQASQIQKVSAQIEMGKFATGRIRRGGHAPQVVLNNQ
jgi:Chaperone of endosialidase